MSDLYLCFTPGVWCPLFWPMVSQIVKIHIFFKVFLKQKLPLLVNIVCLELELHHAYINMLVQEKIVKSCKLL